MTPEEYYAQELSGFEALWNAGHLPGLFDAVFFCQIQKLPLPEWAALGVCNLILERHHSASSGRGGFSRVKKRFEEDNLHFQRWSALDFQLRLAGLLDRTRKPGRPSKAATGDQAKWKAAIAAAAGALAIENVSEAELRQITESYDLVKKSRDGGEGRFLLERLHSL